MTGPQPDPIEVIEELARRLEGGMMCEPCLAARVFGGDHHCTGQAGNRAGQPCPCDGEGCGAV